jgi:predicted transcriptional regulator YdeE
MDTSRLAVSYMQLHEEIFLRCVTASSFPDGVMAAHQELHRYLPFDGSRRYYGLSRPEQSAKGNIVYRAAAEESGSDHAAGNDLDRLTIAPGKYASVLVKKYMQSLSLIGEAFRILIALPNVDPQGYCIEWYLNNEDVCCMVRVID